MDVIENLAQAINLLKDIEEYDEQLNGKNGLISICDQKLEYWEHYLEFEDLKVTESYKIVREIKNIRMLRRKYKNDADLIRVFKENAAKMQNADSRNILLVQVHKKDKEHKNATYKYDAYTDEERNEILGIKVIKENECQE